MTTIVACIDGSPIAAAVCDAAAWASAQLQAEIKLMHVLEKLEYHSQTNLSGNIGLGSREHLLEELTELDERRNRVAMEHGKHLLQEAEQRILDAGAKAISRHQRHGGLLETLHEMEADTRLFILGRLGESHVPFAHTLGNHVESVARSLTKPILITVENFEVPTAFMLAYDGSDTAQKALDRVISSPLLHGLECHLIMAGKPTVENKAMLDSGELKLKTGGFKVQASIVPGEVQPALCHYQEQHKLGLVVMGAFGHSRIRQFFIGSNTSKMMSMSNVPLLLLR